MSRAIRFPPLSVVGAPADMETAVTGAVRRALAGRPGLTPPERDAVARAVAAAVIRRLRGGDGNGRNGSGR